MTDQFLDDEVNEQAVLKLILILSVNSVPTHTLSAISSRLVDLQNQSKLTIDFYRTSSCTLGYSKFEIIS